MSVVVSNDATHVWVTVNGVKVGQWNWALTPWFAKKKAAAVGARVAAKWASSPTAAFA